jgi:hypothetical protein
VDELPLVGERPLVVPGEFREDTSAFLADAQRMLEQIDEVLCG